MMPRRSAAQAWPKIHVNGPACGVPVLLDDGLLSPMGKSAARENTTGSELIRAALRAFVGSRSALQYSSTVSPEPTSCTGPRIGAEPTARTCLPDSSCWTSTGTHL